MDDVDDMGTYGAFEPQPAVPKPAKSKPSKPSVPEPAVPKPAKSAVPPRRPKKDKRTYVGLFVHTWHDIDGGRRHVMGEGPAAPGWNWSFRPAFAGGDIQQFTWKNEAMVDYHVDRFVELGVDFVFLDFTNGNHEENLDGAHALCDKLQARGDGPRVVFWIEKPSDAARYQKEFYGRYDRDLFFEFEGKPLLLVRGDKAVQAGQAGSKPKVKGGALDGFTVRLMWGLLGPRGGSMWSFKETSPARPYVRGGKAEHMGLSFATQTTYMTDESTRKCRDGGKFFRAQAAGVRRHRPRIVTITAYNELMVINLGTVEKPVFTDADGPECSADIIPMKGGHGDKYFRQAKRFIESLA